MSQRPRGLGKGLGALIPSGPPAAPMGSEAVPETVNGTAAVSGGPVPMPDGTYLEEIPLADIRPNPRQPRVHFDDDALEELRNSIVEVGVLQPVVVRELSSGEGHRFELIMGERRFRASHMAERETVPAIVRKTRDDELLREALLENLHRQQLNPLEEAAAYQQMLDDFGTTQGELAQRVGKSRTHVTNTLRLLQLPASLHNKVASGVISAGHARALLSLKEPEAMERMAERVIQEGLSVRSLEEIVALREKGHDVERAERIRKASLKAITPPHVEEWATALADRLDTTVKVDLGKRKGKIVVEFASVEDLERIIEQMGARKA
ncbi:ParB/RepB/Spo0J family partition protein [Nocardiopsis sp. N85]|uniref:ParB/RepB/Spo0J family partition protein n=1 Tax=Nocardiopsis sp. N85 TaxID=3029400 RepID=UPI00237F4531|nr:ParB/RepB/Spo0J family partition protein [Nocardiopsis sp. N85]MDE3723428.1 ParB/RepB/Spo0J family partition protein [Nocardiopsis sp. N85]